MELSLASHSHTSMKASTTLDKGFHGASRGPLFGVSMADRISYLDEVRYR